MAFFDGTATGELINRLSADTALMGESLDGLQLSALLRSLAQIVGSLDNGDGRAEGVAAHQSALGEFTDRRRAQSASMRSWPHCACATRVKWWRIKWRIITNKRRSAVRFEQLIGVNS